MSLIEQDDDNFRALIRNKDDSIVTAVVDSGYIVEQIEPDDLVLVFKNKNKYIVRLHNGKYGIENEENIYNRIFDIFRTYMKSKTKEGSSKNYKQVDHATAASMLSNNLPVYVDTAISKHHHKPLKIVDDGIVDINNQYFIEHH